MTTGERIAARRDELGLKQYQVAEQIGVTKTTMSKYENNVNIPNADILARLASVLRTSADYLCGITDNCAPLGEKWICTDALSYCSNSTAEADPPPCHFLLPGRKDCFLPR